MGFMHVCLSRNKRCALAGPQQRGHIGTDRSRQQDRQSLPYHYRPGGPDCGPYRLRRLHDTGSPQTFCGNLCKSVGNLWGRVGPMGSLWDPVVSLWDPMSSLGSCNAAGLRWHDFCMVPEYSWPVSLPTPGPVTLCSALS